MKNGNAIFEMLKNMSEEERNNTFFDVIAFDFNDFNLIVNEITNNQLLGKNDEDYDKINDIPDDVKKKMINQALRVESSNIHRNEYIDDIFNYIRSLIINYAKNN